MAGYWRQAGDTFDVIHKVDAHLSLQKSKLAEKGVWHERNDKADQAAVRARPAHHEASLKAVRATYPAKLPTLQNAVSRIAETDF